MKSIFYHFLIAVFLGTTLLGSVASHDLLVIENVLNVSDNAVVLQNDGSLFSGSGPNYKEDILNNLIIKNNGKTCSFGEFNESQNPENGFTVAILCEHPIENLSVNDTTVKYDVFQINKVYEVNVGTEKKIFTGEKELYFEVYQSPANGLSLFGKYFKLGMEHIFTGIDHIFFIVGFTVIAVSFISLVKNITGFTLSHSFTLTLAALGIFVLSPSIVEPMIALSIVAVGLMGLFNFGDKKLNAFWLIFAFGLFHGLGFAEAISNIGFPKSGFITSLLGFNLGIELGQLIIVLLFYPVVNLANKYKKGKYFKKIISGIVAVGGIIWLVQRLV